MSATYHPATDPTRPFLKARVKGGTFYNTKKPEGPYTLGTKDWDEAVREYDRRMQHEQPTERDKRVGAAFDAWIETAKLGEDTRANYKSCFNLYCRKAIGGLLVQEVQAKPHIIGIIENAKVKLAGKTGKQVGENESRVNGIYVCLSSFFSDMTKHPTHYREDNPVAKIGSYKPDDVFTKQVGVDEVLTLEEVNRLVECCVPPTRRQRDVIFAKQLALLIYILAFGGMRIGEALALQLTDLIDDGKSPFGEWRIVQQVRRRRRTDKKVPNVESASPTSWYRPLKGKPGKIGDRFRHVPLMSAEVRRRVDEYVAEGLEAGWLKPGGLLFPSATGKARLVNKACERFAVVRDLAGFGEREKPTTLHHLRHTFVSWLLESDEYDIVGIAGLIGDSVKVCSDRYAHLANRSFRNAKAVHAMAVRHGLSEPAGAPEPAAPAAVDNVIQVDFQRAV